MNTRNICDFDPTRIRPRDIPAIRNRFTAFGSSTSRLGQRRACGTREPNVLVRSTRRAIEQTISRGQLPTGGRAPSGSQPHFASDSGPLLGPVPASVPSRQTANPLKSLRTRRDSNPRLLPPEGMGRNRESKDIPRFPVRNGSAEVPQDAVRRTESPSNPARCRVQSDAEALVLALWRAIKVV